MCVLCICTVYAVLCSSLWLKFVPGCPAISVSTCQQLRLGQIVWFGWLSAISQVASRVGGRESWANLSPKRYTTWPRWQEQGGGLRYLPLVPMHTLLVRARRPHKSGCGRRQIPTVCAGQLQPGIQTYFFCRAEFFPSPPFFSEFPGIF
jgi:hypothetical protein